MLASERIEYWLQMIRAEFLEIPGLGLTLNEAGRRWELDPHVADAILRALAYAGLLRRSAEGTYTLRSQEPDFGPEISGRHGYASRPPSEFRPHAS